MSQQQVLSAIEQEISSLENQRLPRNLGYNTSEYERISAEISDLKATRGRINAAVSRGPAALQSELTRAIQRHRLMVSSSAAAAAPSAAAAAAAPSFTGPPRGINGTPAAAAAASAPTPAASAYTSPAAAAPAPSPGGGTTETKQEEDPCPICLGDLNDGTLLHTGPCAHKLHQSCYTALPPAWTGGPKAGQKSCPMCRYNQPVPGPLVEPLRSQQGFGKYIM